MKILFKLLSCKFAPVALSLDKEKFVSRFHFTLGMWIRNCFGLWNKDCKIFEGYDPMMADLASTGILEALWDRFKEECREREISSECYEAFKKLINIKICSYMMEKKRMCIKGDIYLIRLLKLVI